LTFGGGYDAFVAKIGEQPTIRLPRNAIVKIGDKEDEVEVPVSFSGLSSFVGLYQVNAQIPSTAPTGDAVDLSSASAECHPTR
jgi:uncharacterized protein (TIGR03437 family)